MKRLWKWAPTMGSLVLGTEVQVRRSVRDAESPELRKEMDEYIKSHTPPKKQ